MTSCRGRQTPDPAALLIDYGGVLTASVVEAFSAACASIGVDPQGFLNEAFAASQDTDSPFVLLELGRIGEEEFSERLTPVLRRHASVPVDGHQFYAAVQKVTWELDPLMTAAVNGFISAGVPTVLVSNSWGKSDTYPWDRLPGFTAVVVSSDVGMRKPDRDIYLLAAERIGVEPAECVFVDDLEVNLVPARQLGMTTVLHTGAATTITELARLFRLSSEAVAGSGPTPRNA
jgi:putative hydrolase of the HAD superfamily